MVARSGEAVAGTAFGRIRSPRRWILPALCVPLLGAFACSDPEPYGVPEGSSPHVRFVKGPLPDERASHSTTLYWTGWDDDGVVVHYEYAVDPPLVFSTEEIAHPERFEEIRVTRRRGPEEHSDTLLVAKTVDGEEHVFRWIETPETRGRFELDTPVADSTSGSFKKPLNTFHGAHRIYLRAMDNDGLHSETERLGFTAESLTPRSWVTFPFVRGRAYLNTGLQVRVEWKGYDPDPLDGEFLPVGYQYKLIDLRSFDPPLSIYNTNLSLEQVVYRLGTDIPWESADARTLSADLIVAESEYLFVVRAIDATGAVEPFLSLANQYGTEGNVFLFEASEFGARPTIYLREPNFGSWTYRGSPRIFDVEVPAKLPLEFVWEASAEEYGGKIAAISYGLDIADLEAEGPGSGWSPWGDIRRTASPIIFNKEGLHALYVRARDVSGQTQIATLLIRVFEFTFDRPVLLVDDYLNKDHPLDREHDAWWEEKLAATGRIPARFLEREVLWYDGGGDGDRLYLNVTPPTLSLLGRYEQVIWLHGTGYCGYTALFRGGVMGSQVRAYFAAGGKLWVTGQMSSASMFRGKYDCNDPQGPYGGGGPRSPTGETTYPHLDMYRPGTLGYDIFHIATDRLDNDKGMNWEDSFAGATPWEGSPFPPMLVDSTKFRIQRWRTTALTHVDAITDPIFLNGMGVGELDSLYSYRAASYVRPKWRYRSGLEGALCATRWHDPDPSPEGGRNVWFGFPLYYMEDEPAQSVIEGVLDWFAEERPPAPSGRAIRRAFSSVRPPTYEEGLPAVPPGTPPVPGDSSMLPRNR